MKPGFLSLAETRRRHHLSSRFLQWLVEQDAVRHEKRTDGKNRLKIYILETDALWFKELIKEGGT